MSARMQHGRNRSRSPDEYSRKSLLSKVDRRELQKVRVAIKRIGLTQCGPVLPLERDIKDSKQISSLVHIRKVQPRVPIFSGDITVNQDFCDDRTVSMHDRDQKTSRAARTCRSRSRSRSYNENRRNKSTERYRRSSEGRDRDRSRSRSRRKSRSSHRSKSRDRKRYRDDALEKSRRSRSRSRSSSSRSRRSTRKPCKSYDHGRRSITPLRPGEYRPGHPDLALRKQRKLSRSRSRSPRSPAKPVPVPFMGNNFYEDYGQFGPMNPMASYRPAPPGFFPQMYPRPPPMMVPLMPMTGYPRHRMPMFGHRLPVYNSHKKLAEKAPETNSNSQKQNASGEEIDSQGLEEPKL